MNIRRNFGAKTVAATRVFPPFYDFNVNTTVFKDVCANCLCASLLRTQFMSQHHATSRTSAHRKEEIYLHEGMVSVALTSLRFNSLGWTVTPTFFWIDDFLY